MRIASSLLLVTSALTLAACASGGTGSGASLSVADGLTVCPITQVDTTPDPTCVDPGPAPDPTDPDGDGDPIDPDTGVDGDGNTGSGAGGNTASITSGDRTIALQRSVYDPTSSTAPALSNLTSDLSTTHAGTVAAILSPTKPKRLRFRIDTKTDKNSQWAVPVDMTEYRSGSRDISFIAHNHFNTAVPMANGYPSLLDPNGNRTVEWNPTRGRYEFTVTDAVGPVDFRAGQPAPYRDDYYWNQLVATMDIRANGGAGANYREYRVISAAANRDELLQVWAWDDSYAVHYQNAIGGGDPKQDAWSYGGRATAAVPTAGTATYNGRFVANAKTDNWVQVQGSSINPNALWRVEGRTSVTADFGTADIRGTLTPEAWTSFQNDADYTWFTSAADRPSTDQPGYDAVATPNYKFYETGVNIEARMDAGTPTTPASTFTGTATLDEPFVTGDNPVYGGFFGTAAGEVAGVFTASGVDPSPQGGTDGITDNRRGVLIISGAFNGKCTNPDGVCPP
jgi:hypothetical protein